MGLHVLEVPLRGRRVEYLHYHVTDTLTVTAEKINRNGLRDTAQCAQLVHNSPIYDECQTQSG